MRALSVSQEHGFKSKELNYAVMWHAAGDREPHRRRKWRPVGPMDYSGVLKLVQVKLLGRLKARTSGVLRRHGSGMASTSWLEINSYNFQFFSVCTSVMLCDRVDQSESVYSDLLAFFPQLFLKAASCFALCPVLFLSSPWPVLQLCASWRLSPAS